jgi:hypothetical protein
MKSYRFILIMLSFVSAFISADAQTKKATQQLPVDARELASQKMKILDQQLHFSTDQQNQVISILEKYDDPNTANGTTPYTITEQAEREMMEIMSENQLAYYKSNLVQVRNSLKMGSTTTSPAEKKAAPAAKKSSTKTTTTPKSK